MVVVSEKIEDDRDTSEDEATPPQDQFQFRTSILQLIASEKWSELLYFDELERELAAGRLLPGFKSAVPAFPPTFKRIRNLGIEKLIANDESKYILSCIRARYFWTTFYWFVFHLPRIHHSRLQSNVFLFCRPLFACSTF